MSERNVKELELWIPECTEHGSQGNVVLRVQ